MLGALIFVIAFIVFHIEGPITPLAGAGFRLSWLFLFTLRLNCFLFANVGVLIGMLTKTHEITSTYANFFILGSRKIKNYSE
jgi:hypothetical protein